MFRAVNCVVVRGKLLSRGPPKRMNFFKALFTAKTDLDSVYETSAHDLEGTEEIKLESYEGKVLLIVNVSISCEIVG